MVWLCCYSYSSLAYTQQYNVGDTGPNGGTVTSSTLTSVVTNTEVTLNGGFEETTTTTNWTETVVEEIATSTTTTQQVSQITATTTSNFVPTINSSDWSTTGRIKLQGQTQCRTGGSSQTVGAGEACTGYMNNANNSLVANTNNHNFLSLGGGETQSEQFEMSLDMTAAEIQAGFTLNYGVDVESHKSNVTVPLCSNTGGDCKDVFRITTKLFSGPAAWDHSGSGLIAEFSESVTLTYNGTQTHSFTQDLSSTMLTTNSVSEVWGQMELWGVDAGYHSGYYGPVFSNPFMTLTYDAITTITETITQIILSNQTTVYNTSEETLTSVFIGDTTTDTTVIDIDFTEVESFEIAIVNEDTGGGIEMEFSVEVDETTNVATVEMETTNMDTGIVAIDTIVEIDLNLDFGSMDTGPMDVNMPSVESIEADIGSQIDTAVADAVAEIEIDLPDMSTDMGAPSTNMEMADAGPVVELAPPSDSNAGPNVEVEVEVDSGPEPTVEVEVNTSESTNETTTQETVSETESTESTETSEPTSETVQESSENVEQPVDDSQSSSEGPGEGDAESDGDTSGSEAESEAESSGDTGDSNENNESSSRGEESKGKSGNDSKGKGNKNKDKTKSNSEKKKEYVEKKVAEAKQKIATRILAAMADSYSAVNETTKIALMTSLADTKNFQAYLDKQNALPLDWYTDEQIYTEMPMLLDPAGILYDMAQDKIMDEMIMMQYE